MYANALTSNADESNTQLKPEIDTQFTTSNLLTNSKADKRNTYWNTETYTKCTTSNLFKKKETSTLVTYNFSISLYDVLSNGCTKKWRLILQY